MEIAQRYAHIVPGRTQTLLIHAALQPLNKAVDAWNEWKQIHPINPAEASLRDRIQSNMDPCSKRLLPLIFRNLQPANDPIALMFEQDYQRTLKKNKRRIAISGQIINSLQNAGFETIMLKGTVLSLIYYRDLGVRKSSDIDFMLPGNQFRDACIFLEERLGLTPEVSGKSIFFPGMRDVMHSQVFRNKKRLTLDVHQRLFHEHSEIEKMDLFWRQKQPLQLGDSTCTNMLSTTHLLFHVIAHVRSPKPALRWISDALIILQHASPSIDWKELLSLIKRFQFTSLFQIALPLLANTFDAPIPNWVLEQIKRQTVPSLEQKYFHVLSSTPRNPISKLHQFFYRDWLRQCVYNDTRPTFFSFWAGQKNRLLYRWWETRK